MSFWLHRFYGYRTALTGTEAQELHDHVAATDPEVSLGMYELGPRVFGVCVEGEAPASLLVGCPTHEFSIEPRYGIEPVDWMKAYDVRLDAAFDDVIARAPAFWAETLRGLPERFRHPDRWAGPTLWLCPHT